MRNSAQKCALKSVGGQRELGTTTFYVTHDQIEAMSMADRIAILEAGKIQQLGTPSDIYNHPANLFVAGFIGNPSMNLHPMRYLQYQRRTSLEIGETTQENDNSGNNSGGSASPKC